MGWASAGRIFDRVAWALIEARASDQTLDSVLYELATMLTDDDWDTVDESIGEFAGHPVVQHALYKANGSQYLYCEDDRVEGYIQFVGNADGGIWELDLRGVIVQRPGTIAGFNELIDEWASVGGTAAYAKAAGEHRLK